MKPSQPVSDRPQSSELSIRNPAWPHALQRASTLMCSQLICVALSDKWGIAFCDFALGEAKKGAARGLHQGRSEGSIRTSMKFHLTGEVSAPGEPGRCRCGARGELSIASTTKGVLRLCPACVVMLLARGPAPQKPDSVQWQSRRGRRDAMKKRLPGSAFSGQRQ